MQVAGEYWECSDVSYCKMVFYVGEKKHDDWESSEK